MPTQAELVEFALSRSRDAAELWNFYIIVVSAIIVLFSSGRTVVTERRVKAAAAIIFGLFAIGNLYALFEINEQRVAFVSLITEPGLQTVAATIRPGPVVAYLGFHILLDLVVVIGILFVPWPVEPKGKA